MSFLRFIAPALAALVLTGCTTPTAPTGETPHAATATGTGPAPAVPAPVPVKVELPPASIRGSEESSTLLDNFTVFVTALDGQPIGTGRAGWNQPFSFVPGRRHFTVEFNRGVFVAHTELVLEAKPGAAYELRQTSDAQVYGGHSYCEFWIVDLATGAKVTAVKRTALSNVKGGL